MLSETVRKLLRSTAFRLTGLYALTLTLAAVAFLLITYPTLKFGLDKKFDQRLMGEIREFRELHPQGLEAIQAEFELEEIEEGSDNAFFRLLSPELDVLASTLMPHWPGIDRLTPAMIRNLRAKEQVIHAVAVPGHEFGARVICARMSNGEIFQIGLSYGPEGLLLERYIKLSMVVASSMIAFGCVVVWFITRRLISGVKRVTKSAVSIAEGDLSEHVVMVNQFTEIEELVAAFNGMIEKIRLLIRELKDVTRNISHDLRSPVTRIRLIAESALTGEESIDNYREGCSEIVEECDRLVDTVNTILDVAEMESGARKFDRQAIDIAELVREAGELYLPVAENRRIEIIMDVGQSPIMIVGDRNLLQRAVANLVDNAVKYTPARGEVTLQVMADDRNVSISIINSGTIINSNDLPHIFKPFYRGDKSRSSDGNGLGLSLVNAILTLHHFDIRVASNAEDGTVFTIMAAKLIGPSTDRLQDNVRFLEKTRLLSDGRRNDVSPAASCGWEIDV